MEQGSGPSVAGILQCVVLDCPQVAELARFYQSLLGGEINRRDPRWATSADFSTLHTSSLVLGFQRVARYEPPQWPDATHPQQIHFDVEVPDLDQAGKLVLSIGATLLHADPRGWRIYADPAGHPFCLLAA
jgi:catechol 2,3-dioxygenase-like lactoylglutathione lyase family enzyme